MRSSPSENESAPAERPAPRVRRPPGAGAVVSIRHKLAGLLLAILVGVSAILLLVLPRAMDELSRRWIVSRSVGLGQLVAGAVEAAVDFDDAGAARAALGGLERSQGAAYAVLLRGDGSVLASWGDRAAVAEPPGTAVATALQGRLLHVRYPISTRAGRSALLLLGFALDELEERRAEARAVVAETMGVVLVAGLIAAVLIAGLLIRPLRRMTRAAHGIAAGEEDAARYLPVTRRDEFGVLARAFSRMLERLYDQRAEIRAINADLAERVQERTRELARTNAALDELARTQEQLVLADRRVSIGRLAAGVAHEINNPLSFLRANLDYLSRQLPEIAAAAEGGRADAVRELLGDTAEALADARQGAVRVTHIVRGLNTFGRDDQDVREVVRLDAPFDAAIEMATNEIKHRARLERDFGPCPAVEGNEVRLSQVFLNLLMNAAQAIPDDGGGQHRIRCATRTDARGWAVAEVEDTGCGMTPEVQARIFEPFFTTKPVGGGTGLGLSITRNLVEQHGGEIAVESAPGRGTTFRLSLPPASPEAIGRAAARRARAEPGPAVRAGVLRGLRVLLVDDEPLVADAVQRVLPELTLVPVATGAEALARVRAGERFDRILCDVMMPEMSGPELVRELLAHAPDLRERIVLMTGGTFTPAAEAFVRAWTGHLVTKPFDDEALRRSLA